MEGFWRVQGLVLFAHSRQDSEATFATRTGLFASNSTCGGCGSTTKHAVDQPPRRKRWDESFWRRFATIVKPETLLAWHRKLIAHKYDGRKRGPGRPSTAEQIEVLLVRMAEENRDWGYRRSQGDRIHNLASSTRICFPSTPRRSRHRPMRYLNNIIGASKIVKESVACWGHYSGTTAVASISTRAWSSSSATTCTTVMAG